MHPRRQIVTIERMEKAIPAVAMPLPLSLPPLPLILTRLMIPIITAGIAVSTKNSKLKNPKTKEIIAYPQIFDFTAMLSFLNSDS